MGMIPLWLSEKRQRTCFDCVDKSTCVGQYTILDEVPACPLGKLPNLDDAIAARAWPAGAPEPTNCCGSALHYTSR